MIPLFRLIAVILLIGFFTASNSIEFVGHPEVIDGDTIKIEGIKLRLFGIDAPEKDQECNYLGAPWKCGLSAKINLINKIGNEMVLCKANKQDKYSRYIAKCYLGDEDLSQWMVENGFALAYSKYSKKYVIVNEMARQLKVGIWSSDFTTPENIRKQNKLKPVNKRDIN